MLRQVPAVPGISCASKGADRRRPRGSLGKYQQFHGNMTLKLFRAQWTSWLGEDLQGVVESCIPKEKLILKKKFFKRSSVALWWGNRMFEKGLWECWAEEVLHQFVSLLLKLFVALLQGHSDGCQAPSVHRSKWMEGGWIDFTSLTCLWCAEQHLC